MSLVVVVVVVIVLPGCAQNLFLGFSGIIVGDFKKAFIVEIMKRLDLS